MIVMGAHMQSPTCSIQARPGRVQIDSLVGHLFPLPDPAGFVAGRWQPTQSGIASEGFGDCLCSDQLVGFALDVEDLNRVTVTVPDDTGEIVTRHCSPPRCSTRRARGKGEGKRPRAPLPHVPEPAGPVRVEPRFGRRQCQVSA